MALVRAAGARAALDMWRQEAGGVPASRAHE